MVGAAGVDVERTVAGTRRMSGYFDLTVEMDGVDYDVKG